MNNAVCRQLTWSKSKSQSELVISCRQQLHNFIKIQIIQSLNLWSHNPIRFCGTICTELTLSLHSWNELLQWRVVRITAPQALMLPHSYAQHQMQPNVTDTARSIYLSVCLLVTTMSPQKWPNQSRCHCRGDSRALSRLPASQLGSQSGRAVHYYLVSARHG